MENASGGSFRKRKLPSAVLGIGSVSMSVGFDYFGWNGGNASDCISCENLQNVSEAVGEAVFLLFLYGRSVALSDTATAAD